MHEFDEFEEELRQALERRPAPPGLKRKIMERRSARDTRRSRLDWLITPWADRSRVWVQLAATLVIAALLGGGVRWGVEKREQQRRGEEAREQVRTALRITGHALNEVQERLAAHDRNAE